MSILCKTIGHWRSYQRIRRGNDMQWRSFCRWCGHRMVRQGPKKWRLDDDASADQGPKPLVN